jgi:acyl-coenzyme A thioesterase PaaI-like protein
MADRNQAMTDVRDAIRLEPNPSNHCFGCGGANNSGMKLTFEQDNAKRRIIGRFVLGERYQGGGGMAHGGIIATLLDEAMGRSAVFAKCAPSPRN